jgi:hypothetical protein
MNTSTIGISDPLYNHFPLFPYYNGFPTAGIKASELSIIIWKAIEKLSDWGFSVDYIMQDGGEENRNLMSMHFRGNANEMLYGSPNLVCCIFLV